MEREIAEAKKDLIKAKGLYLKHARPMCSRAHIETVLLEIKRLANSYKVQMERAHGLEYPRITDHFKGRCGGLAALVDISNIVAEIEDRIRPIIHEMDSQGFSNANIIAEAMIGGFSILAREIYRRQQDGRI